MSDILIGTIESSSTALVTVPKANILTVFTEPNAINTLLAQIAKEARAFHGDPSTAKGREDIASMAYKVARTKTYLDGLGKDLVADMKELPKKVDASRKSIRDFLDTLKDEIRQPLTDWEAEQERIEAERKAAADAEALAKDILYCHEIGLLINADLDRKREEAIKAEAQAKADRDARIAQEAADRARQEAEDKARLEQEAAQRREIEARLNQERAEREKAEAEQRAKDAEAREAKARKEADDRAEQAAIEAKQAEQARQAEEQRRAKAEQDAREADIEHRRKFNQEAIADLELCGITTEQAKVILTAIAQKKVRHIAVVY